MILSSKTQARIIAELLNCQEVQVNLDDLTEPWREYYDWVQEGDENETSEDRRSAFVQAFVPRSDRDRECYTLIREFSEAADTYPPINDLLAFLPDLQWLWPDWVPRALLSLLVAESGVGKSYLTLDLARRVVAGDEYPDGSPVAQRGNVLYVDAENIPQIFKMRLAGWNEEERQRLFFMFPAPGRMMLSLEDFEDRDRLLDMMWQIKPELVIVDSYGSITLRGENAKEDVQETLSFLSKVAVDYNCAMVVNHHLRKKSSLQIALPAMPMTIDTIRGSSHIAAMARNVLGLQLIQTGPDINRNGPRKLQVIKSNLGRYPEPIGVFFEPMADDPSVARIRYGDVPQAYSGLSKLEECMIWLMETMESEGALPPAKIIEWAEEEGFSRRTVYRARNQLGARITNTEDTAHHSQNKWILVEPDGEEN